MNQLKLGRIDKKPRYSIYNLWQSGQLTAVAICNFIQTTAFPVANNIISICYNLGISRDTASTSTFPHLSSFVGMALIGMKSQKNFN